MTDCTMNYSDYIIYVDESGDHNSASVDKDYPVFVLNFCIFQKDHYAKVVTPRMQEFKFTHFGHDIVVLHEYDIRKRRFPFVFLGQQKRHDAFMDDLKRIIKQVEFTIIAAVVRKEQLKSKHAYPDDPYEMALTFCMEMVYAFMRDIGQHDLTTHIVVERRGKREDKDLKYAFQRICVGRNWLGATPCFEIIFADKKVNSVGLQLADLTARPIGLHVLRPGQPNRAWNLIEPKIHRDLKGQMGGRGMRIFP